MVVRCVGVFAYVIGLQLSPAVCGQGRPEASREVFDFCDSVAAFDVEFQADITFRLMDQKAQALRPRAERTLEDLFQSASQAKVRCRYRSVGSLRDTLDGRISDAQDQQLDELSIRCRVVKAMIDRNRQLALELFRQIYLPKMPLVTCKDALVPDISIFYETASALFTRCFSELERSRGHHIAFLRPLLHRIENTAEILPALRLVSRLKVTGAERSELSNIVAERLRLLPAASRQFSFAEYRLGLSQAVRELAEVLAKDGKGSSLLIESYRTFLVRQLSQRTCADGMSFEMSGVHDDAPIVSGNVKETMSFFNAVLRPLGGDRRVSSTLRHPAWEFTDFLLLSFGRAIPAC